MLLLVATGTRSTRLCPTRPAVCTCRSTPAPPNAPGALPAGADPPARLKADPKNGADPRRPPGPRPKPPRGLVRTRPAAAQTAATREARQLPPAAATPPDLGRPTPPTPPAPPDLCRARLEVSPGGAGPQATPPAVIAAAHKRRPPPSALRPTPATANDPPASPSSVALHPAPAVLLQARHPTPVPLQRSPARPRPASPGILQRPASSARPAPSSALQPARQPASQPARPRPVPPASPVPLQRPPGILQRPASARHPPGIRPAPSRRVASPRRR